MEAAANASANVGPALNVPPDHEHPAARDGIEDVARDADVVPVPEARPEVAEMPPPVAPVVPAEEVVPEAPVASLAGAPDPEVPNHEAPNREVPNPEAPNPEAPMMVPQASHGPDNEGRRPLPNVELCAFCQCPNVEDEEHGPMVN